MTILIEKQFQLLAPLKTNKIDTISANFVPLYIGIEAYNKLRNWISRLQEKKPYSHSEILIDRDKESIHEHFLRFNAVETCLLKEGKEVARYQVLFPERARETKNPSVTNLSKFTSIRFGKLEAHLESPFSCGSLLLKGEYFYELLKFIDSSSPIAQNELTDLLAEMNFLATPNDQCRELTYWTLPDLIAHSKWQYFPGGGGNFHLSGKLPEFTQFPTMSPGTRKDIPMQHDSDYQKLARKRRTPTGDVHHTQINFADFSRVLRETLSNQTFLHKKAIFRNYPSPGAMHTLNFYFLISNVENCDPGLYQYDCQNSCLIKLERKEEEITEYFHLLKDWLGSLPSAHLFVTSRYGRLSWKYDSIAYRLVLLEAGVLLGNLCLAATASNLEIKPRGASMGDLIERKILRLTKFIEVFILELSLISGREV